MTLKYVSLPLFEDPHYTYAISLEDNSYVLEFKYNERMQSYCFGLLDADLNPIVIGERLVPTYPMFKDYALPNLSGWFWMEEISDIISEPYKIYPQNISQYYNFYYVWDEED